MKPNLSHTDQIWSYISETNSKFYSKVATFEKQSKLVRVLKWTWQVIFPTCPWFSSVWNKDTHQQQHSLWRWGSSLLCPLCQSRSQVSVVCQCRRVLGEDCGGWRGHRHSETTCTASSDVFFLIQMSGPGTGGGIPWEIKSAYNTPTPFGALHICSKPCLFMRV